jgi:hypothetical protein
LAASAKREISLCSKALMPELRAPRSCCRCGRGLLNPALLTYALVLLSLALTQVRHHSPCTCCVISLDPMLSVF